MNRPQQLMSLVSHLGLVASLALPMFIAGLGASACQGGSSVGGNENGSEPINDGEAQEYKKAIVRCYKTGGTKVVKIMGELRCY